jgi:nitrate reductase cytochrome c-type subunit
MVEESYSPYGSQEAKRKSNAEREREQEVRGKSYPSRAPPMVPHVLIVHLTLNSSVMS